MEKLITTKQYMGNPSELHHAYFLQFATHRTESYVLSSLKVDDIKKAMECGDVHLNEIKIPYNNMGYGAYRDWETDRKSTRLNSSHSAKSRMPSSA